MDSHSQYQVVKVSPGGSLPSLPSHGLPQAVADQLWAGLMPLGARHGQRPLGARHGPRPLGARHGLRPLGARHGPRPLGARHSPRPLGPVLLPLAHYLTPLAPCLTPLAPCLAPLAPCPHIEAPGTSPPMWGHGTRGASSTTQGARGSKTGPWAGPMALGWPKDLGSKTRPKGLGSKTWPKALGSKTRPETLGSKTRPEALESKTWPEALGSKTWPRPLGQPKALGACLVPPCSLSHSPCSLSHSPHSLPCSPCSMLSPRDSTTYVGAWGKGTKQHNTGSKGGARQDPGLAQGLGSKGSKMQPEALGPV